MSQKTITLAYCVENGSIVRSIEQELTNTPYDFQKFPCTHFHQEDKNIHGLLEQNNPVLLIVSENFLKSVQCMKGALKMLQTLSRQNRVLPIIADGEFWDEDTQQVLTRRTVFEKVSNVIHYMNYWQEQYLDVRRQKRKIEEEELPQFNEKLKAVRSVSSEVGEFLRLLRGMNYVYYEDFERTHFQALFRFTGHSALHSGFKSERIQAKVQKKENAVQVEAGDMIAAFKEGTKEVEYNQRQDKEEMLVDEVINEIGQIQSEGARDSSSIVALSMEAIAEDNVPIEQPVISESNGINGHYDHEEERELLNGEAIENTTEENTPEVVNDIEEVVGQEDFPNEAIIEEVIEDTQEDGLPEIVSTETLEADEINLSGEVEEVANSEDLLKEFINEELIEDAEEDSLVEMTTETLDADEINHNDEAEEVASSEDLLKEFINEELIEDTEEDSLMEMTTETLDADEINHSDEAEEVASSEDFPNEFITEENILVNEEDELKEETASEEVVENMEEEVADTEEYSLEHMLAEMEVDEPSELLETSNTEMERDANEPNIVTPTEPIELTENTFSENILEEETPKGALMDELMSPDKEDTSAIVPPETTAPAMPTLEDLMAQHPLETPKDVAKETQTLNTNPPKENTSSFDTATPFTSLEDLLESTVSSTDKQVEEDVDIPVSEDVNNFEEFLQPNEQEEDKTVEEEATETKGGAFIDSLLNWTEGEEEAEEEAKAKAEAEGELTLESGETLEVGSELQFEGEEEVEAKAEGIEGEELILKEEETLEVGSELQFKGEEDIEAEVEAKAEEVEAEMIELDVKEMETESHFDSSEEIVSLQEQDKLEAEVKAEDEDDGAKEEVEEEQSKQLLVEAALLAGAGSVVVENINFGNKEKELHLADELEIEEVNPIETIFETEILTEETAIEEREASEEILSNEGAEVMAEQMEEAIISVQATQEKDNPEETIETTNSKEVLESIPNLELENEQETTDDMNDINKAIALVEKGRIKEAGKLLKKAAKSSPNDMDIQYQYANFLNELVGNPQKAAKHYKKTLKLQPDHPFAYYDLALIYYNQGDRFRAHRAYQKAAKINPELKTEQNDLAFRYVPQPLKDKNKGIDQDKIQSLQEHIERLEQLLVAQQSDMTQAREVPVASTKPTKELAKVVLITGATAGIGKATAEVFAKNGHKVILTGRRTERLKILKAGFESKFDTEVQILPFDVRDTKAVKAAIESLDEEWKQVDILINNAGLGKGYGDIHECELEHWDTMIDTNVKGLLYMTRAIAPYMVERRDGHIINVGSTVGQDVYRKGNVYCATKAAVGALTKAMRLDLHEYNVRVSQVSPAHTEDTEFAVVRHEDPSKAKIYDDFQPLKASDVAETIYFIATRPKHVNVLDVVLQGTQQPSATIINRSGR